MSWENKEGYSTRVLASGRNLEGKDYEIQLVCFRKGKHSHFHKRKTEFFFFMSGKGKAVIDKKEEKIGKDSFFTIKPNQLHAIINESEDSSLNAIMVKIDNDKNDTFVPSH